MGHINFCFGQEKEYSEAVISFKIHIFGINSLNERAYLSNIDCKPVYCYLLKLIVPRKSYHI